MMVGSLITRQSQKTPRGCIECEVIFIPKHSTKGMFCSKACKYKDGRRNYRAEKDGYIWIYPDVDKYDASEYPGAATDGRIREHRYFMQEYLGRPLEKYETVHHKNGDTMDNRIENLELRVGRHGKGATSTHCATCSCFEGVM